MSHIAPNGQWVDEQPMDRFVVHRSGGRRCLMRKVWRHSGNPGHFSVWMKWITWLDGANK